MAPQPDNGRGSARLLNPFLVEHSPYYSHAAQAFGPSNIVVTAGQVGRRLDGTISSDPSQEIRDALANLSQSLEAAGAGVRDIIKLTYYKVGHDHKNPIHRGPMMEFLGEHRPPTTLVPLVALATPEMRFEIEATAAIPQYSSEHFDVIVIGGGLSGLQAAVDIHKAGYKVKVLEARDRVGGKTLSLPTRGGMADVGAAWINDSTQSKMYALAKHYRLGLLDQNTTGNIVVDNGIGKHRTHPYGQLIGDSSDEHIIADVIRMRDTFEATCQKIDVFNPVSSGLALDKNLDSVTLEDWLRSHECSEDAVNAFRVGTRAMLGVEPSEMSALFFLHYAKSGGGYLQMRSDLKHGGQYLRVEQGTQSFSRCLASELPSDAIYFQSPVRKLEQRDGYVRVRSARGIFTATRVIVSVPTPLYDEIEFDPPLPQEKQGLSKATRLGDTCKMILFYEKAWWRYADLCGLAQSCEGPIAVTRDTSTHKAYSLTCFVVGQPAREWMRLDQKSRQQAVLDQLRRLYSPFAKVDEPVEVVEHIWRAEQWSQGCPCPVLGPGGMTAFHSALQSTHGHIHFVGTETSHVWKGYMEGAVRSGERGAQEVILAMDRPRL